LFKSQFTKLSHVHLNKHAHASQEKLQPAINTKSVNFHAHSITMTKIREDSLSALKLKKNLFTKQIMIKLNQTHSQIDSVKITLNQCFTQSITNYFYVEEMHVKNHNIAHFIIYMMKRMPGMIHSQSTLQKAEMFIPKKKTTEPYSHQRKPLTVQQKLTCQFQFGNQLLPLII